MPPAARISDMHTCPMATPGTPPVPHVGGPVITGAPTVIVAFMPQARISDQCTCVGPPDVIVKGSPTVYVAGMPAARIGDTTVHGGVITTGAPNVLIGDVGTGGAVSLSQAMPGAPAAPGMAGDGPPPVDRPEEVAIEGKPYEVHKEQMTGDDTADAVLASASGPVSAKVGSATAQGKAGTAASPALTPAIVSPICMQLAKDLAEAKQAKEDMELAAAAYEDDDHKLPAGWERAGEDDLRDLALVDSNGKNLTRIEGTDFRADVFVRPDPNNMPDGKEYTIAFRGTSTFKPFSSQSWNPMNSDVAASMMQYASHLNPLNSDAAAFIQRHAPALTKLMSSTSALALSVAERIGIKPENKYYNRAIEIGKRSKRVAPGPVKFVGHSLGGGLALAAGGVGGLPVSAFNGANLSDRTIKRLKKMSETKVTSYYIEGEILDVVQKHGLHIPSAKGNRRSLPQPRSIPRKQGHQFTKYEYGLGALFAGLPGVAALFGYTRATDAVATVLHSGEMHRCESLLASLDQVIEEIRDERKTNQCP